MSGSFRWRRICVVSSILLVATVIAGCAGSSNSGSSNAASGGSSGSGGTITVGNIASLSGPAGDTYNGYNAGLTAYFKYIDAHGGVAGHQINFISLDDAADASTNLTDAHTLVQQDHVIAIVGESSLADVASQKYLQQNGIPVIGGWPTSSVWAKPSTNMFENLEGTNYPYCPLWSAPLAKAMGITKIAYVALDLPVAISDGDCHAQAGKRVGLQMAGKQIDVALTDVDYTPVIQQAMQAGANGIQLSTTGSAEVLAVQAGEQLGYKGYYILDSPSGFLQGIGSMASSLSGRVITSVFSLLPYEPSDNPQLATAVKAIKQYEPSYASDITAISGWAAGVEFEATLKAAGTNPANMIKWLSSQRNYDFDGLQGPVSYVQGSIPNPCTLQLVLENGKFVPPANLPADLQGFNCTVEVNTDTGAVLVGQPSS